MSLGIVRGFSGTMQPSDFSSACMPIVRLLPSWAGPECCPDTDEISQVPTKGRHHVHMGSTTARGSSSASHCAGRMLLSRQRNGVSTSKFDPFRSSIPSPWSPCERSKLALAGSPCITRGRGGWLGLTQWKTFTSYPLASLLGAPRYGSGSTGLATSGAQEFSRFYGACHILS